MLSWYSHLSGSQVQLLFGLQLAPWTPLLQLTVLGLS